MEKELLTGIGIIITLIGYTAYIYSIFKGNTKPHPFSWIVFATLTAIGFFAQLSDGGGTGSYITGLSALISYVIAIIALENFTIITVLYPLSLVISNFAFLILLYYRRWRLKNEQR